SANGVSLGSSAKTPAEPDRTRARTCCCWDSGGPPGSAGHRVVQHECNCHGAPLARRAGSYCRRRAGRRLPWTQPAAPKASLILVIASVSLGLTPVFALATGSATPIASS